MAAPPAELKAIAPYLARASELEKAEPVISYWCTPIPLRATLNRTDPALISLVRRCRGRTGTYYALQQAMSLGSKDPESQVYLFELMDKLESVRRVVPSLPPGNAMWGVPLNWLTLDGDDVQTKAAHAGEEAFTDDVAAAAYIENFGLKLFSQADTEDRKGKSTRCARGFPLPAVSKQLTRRRPPD